MKSQTSLVAQQTRLSKWAEQIKECQKRPQGMNEQRIEGIVTIYGMYDRGKCL